MLVLAGVSVSVKILVSTPTRGMQRIYRMLDYASARRIISDAASSGDLCRRSVSRAHACAALGPRGDRFSNFRAIEISPVRDLTRNVIKRKPETSYSLRSTARSRVAIH